MTTKKKARGRRAKREPSLKRWARRGTGDRLADWNDFDDAALEVLAPAMLRTLVAAMQLAMSLAELRRRVAEIGGRR